MGGIWLDWVDLGWGLGIERGGEEKEKEIWKKEGEEKEIWKKEERRKETDLGFLRGHSRGPCGHRSDQQGSQQALCIALLRLLKG